MSVLLEVCCGSADDVIQAEKAGAHRVELNCDLFHGGLTPSIGTFRVAKARTLLPIIAMIRPRAGGFCYTEAEFAVAMEDARALLEAGAAGLAFGFLKEDGTLDLPRMRAMASLVQQHGRETVCHRAFDVVPDWMQAMDALVDLGITRILTSGQEPNAIMGVRTLRRMLAHAADRIQILPGGGIKAHNVADFIADTGCDAVHLSGHMALCDPSTQGRAAIHFGSALYPPEDRYAMIDADYIRSVQTHLT